MATTTDFVAFYKHLGVSPDCSLDDLKRAYRRRISALHPDRLPETTRDKLDASRLQDLTISYNAVLSFHRRFGRLPGTPARAARPREELAVPASTTVSPELGLRPSRLRRGLLAIALLALLAWLLSGVETQVDDGAGFEGDATANGSAPGQRVMYAPQQSTRLGVGMDKATTTRIQGRPVTAGSLHWDYGPSWIDFDRNGTIIDWYSSPLRPLKVTSQRPPPTPAADDDPD